MQNFALNVAEHGFKISVYNRSYEKTEAAVTRAGKESESCLLTRYLEEVLCLGARAPSVLTSESL